MKSLLSLIKILSIITLLSSCAYENDPGLSKPAAKPAVNDVLKNKTDAEKLKTKYKSLAAKCTLESVVAPPPASGTGVVTSEEVAEATPADAPKEPLTVNPDKKGFTFDLLAQLAKDPGLTASVPVSLENSANGLVVSLKLTLTPLTFIEQLTVPVASLRYIMKHTPLLAYQYDVKVTSAKSTFAPPTGLVKVNEKIPSAKVLATSEVPDADDDTKVVQLNHVLTCELAGEINPENKDNETEFKSQWDSLDCAKAPEKGKEELHKANCPAGK